jgi:HD-GYP domain-containing protein (c-di-GMP phosphodiesterase class II)
MEVELIHTHAKAGYDILKDITFPWPIAEIVYQHHERLNGSGYPQKIKGEEILMEARIIGVADVVEAMSSHRPYRPTLGIDQALEEINQNRNILFDGSVVDTCINLFQKSGYKWPESTVPMETVL